LVELAIANRTCQEWNIYRLVFTERFHKFLALLEQVNNALGRHGVASGWWKWGRFGFSVQDHTMSHLRMWYYFCLFKQMWVGLAQSALIWTTDWAAGVLFLARAGDSSLLNIVQTGCGTHPVPYPMGTGGSFPWSKAAWTWWPLTSIWCRGQEWWNLTSTLTYAYLINLKVAFACTHNWAVS
jgi:hypothetical protein